MKALSLLFIYLGSLLLVAALFPTRKLCNQQHHATLAWRVLGVMIIIFLFCYIFYGLIILKSSNPDLTSLFISSILLSGGFFVFTVVKLTQVSINQISKLIEEEIHRSMHDDLTELPNRRFLNNRIDTIITDIGQNAPNFAVLLVDLHNFKEVNDALGHFYGDFILQQVAARLQTIAGANDTLARWGGDKFSLLLPDADERHAIEVSRRITDTIAEPFKVEGRSLSLLTSTGIVVYPDHGPDAESLLQHADIAMYEANRNHVNYSVFNPDKNRSTFERLVLTSDIRRAIEREEMVLYYQPQISVITNGITGVEALARWNHPQKGIILPNEFITIVEKTGLSSIMTKWALDNAIRQNHEWLKMGIDINMSINISANDLHDFEFPKLVRGLVERWKINPKHLTLEITESGIMVDLTRVTEIINELEDIGLNLSIDDFGTGYSSLAYLRKFPAREIKIDKSFVSDMLTNEDSAMIVKSTIDMAHNIGRRVIAEGVESHDTHVLLKRLGCDFLQGFYISAPMPAVRFQEWYNENAGKFPGGSDHLITIHG